MSNRIAEGLQREVAAGALTWLEGVWRDGDQTDLCRLLPLLVGVAAACRMGGESRLLDEVLRAVSQAGEGEPNAPLAGADARYAAGAAHLLAALGRRRPPVLTDTPAADGRPASPMAFLFLDADGLLAEVDRWSSLTSFGRRPVPAAHRQRARELCDVLPAVAVAQSRLGHLRSVAAMLRLMVYLGAAPWAQTEVAEYLALQQRPEGSFGFANPLNPGLDRLWAAPQAGSRLQVTVEVLWALSELRPTGGG